MKFKILAYHFIFICLLHPLQLFGQRLGATDKSESNVRRYQNVIRNNQQLVNFIEYSFTVKGIPKHMRNLAIIESHLDRNQVSNMGASGVWQLMSAHANSYGLSDGDRSDRYKSTKAVTASLINLYNKYHNWVTVVAAYNCGEGNISKAMARAGSKNYTVFAGFLPAETQNHVQKYLNACYATGELDAVLQDFYKTGSPKKQVTKKPASKAKVIEIIPSAEKTEESNIVKTSINGAYKLAAIAKFLDVSSEEILQLNPDLEKDLNEKGEANLFLPKSLMDKFKLNQYKILTSSLK